MVKDEVCVVKRRVFADSKTGREVWQVSPDGCANVTNYFYMTCFSPDDHFLFYNSTRSGSNQVHRVHLETGETAQMTSVAGGIGHHDWNLHPNGRELFFKDNSDVRAGQDASLRRAPGPVRAMDLENGETRVVFDPAGCAWIKGGVGGPIRFSGSGPFDPAQGRPEGTRMGGKYFCFQFVHDPRECVAPDMWSHHGLVKYTRCGVARAACDGAGAQCLYLHNEAMQHLMFCPADDDLLNFAVWPDYQNNEALMDNHRARAWLVDVKADAARPYLVMPKRHRATHEYWSPSGDRLFYHKKQADGIWAAPRWFPCSIGWMDRATGRQTDFIRSDTQMLGHSICTPDGAKVVSDNDDFARPNELVLVDVRTGRSEVLWWPNVSGKDKRLAHGGPIMSATGAYVGYTSDYTGEAQVYLTRI